MAVNKVVFGAVSIMDISDSTVTADKLAKGVTAYDKAGEKITGTMEASSAPTLQEKTVTPSTSAQSITADNGYDGLSKVTVNAMPTATQATPSITISSAGKITASATQSAGYVAAGTKSATKQLTTQAAKNVTPTTSNQTAVASGRYTTGAVTVKGDANLVAGNIKSGTTIFGVTGSYEGSGGGSSGGSASFTTGTITGTKKMSSPGAYNYTYDLSVIPNLDSANIIVLEYEYTTNSYRGLVSLHRENANDAFYITGGYINAMTMKITSNILKLSEAYDATASGIDLASCIYYAK